MGGQTYGRVVIRWENAYASSHYIGWSNDGSNFSGYWYSIAAPGVYAYDLGTHNNRYLALLMRTRAPSMANFSLWEFEAYAPLSTFVQVTDVVENEGIPILSPDGELETMMVEYIYNLFMPIANR
jgi:hypothetical protein